MMQNGRDLKVEFDRALTRVLSTASASGEYDAALRGLINTLESILASRKGKNGKKA